MNKEHTCLALTQEEGEAKAQQARAARQKVEEARVSKHELPAKRKEARLSRDKLRAERKEERGPQ